MYLIPYIGDDFFGTGFDDIVEVGYFNDTATTEIYTLSLHDALPIYVLPSGSQLGGAPANFAYHAGQHGLHSVAVSAVGKDAS